MRPSWLWFLLLDGGIVVLSKLALSKSAYDKAGEMSGDALPPARSCRRSSSARWSFTPPRPLAAGRMARRRGLPARGWRMQTFVVGFPSLLALRRSAPPG